MVVVGLNAAHYRRATGLTGLRSALENAQRVLQPMSREQLVHAIRDPALKVGLDIQPGLIELLLRDLGVASGSSDSAGVASYEAERLPLLAHALRRTWSARQGNLLTLDAYASTGGIAGAIAQSAEEVYERLGDQQKVLAQAMFVGGLVRVGASPSQDTRRSYELNRSSGEVTAEVAAAVEIVQAFAVPRLVTLRGDSAEITHDTLISSWPRLRDWLNDDRPANLVRQQLEDDADRWQQASRDPSHLYRGSRLSGALALGLTAARIPLSPVASSFVEASSRVDSAAARRRRVITVVVAVLAVISLAGAAMAWVQTGAAQRQTALAEQERNTAVASSLVSAAERERDDPNLAAQLRIAASQEPRAVRYSFWI